MTELPRSVTPSISMDEESQPLDEEFGALDDEDASDSRERKRLFEGAIPEAVKRVVERAVETGVEKLVEGPDNIRALMNDLKLPKEAVQYFYHQIDDTKKGVYRVVAKEIRDVLEHTNISDELAEVLTKLSFEITTQVRFVPNREGTAADKDGDEQSASDNPDSAEAKRTKIPRPQVVSKVVMKARDKLDRLNKDPST